MHIIYRSLLNEEFSNVINQKIALYNERHATVFIYPCSFLFLFDVKKALHNESHVILITPIKNILITQSLFFQ